MRQYVAVLVFSLAFSLVAVAQDFPAVEIFGGYSYLHVDTQGIDANSLTLECNVISGGNCPLAFQIHPGFNGFAAAGQFNLNSWFGLKADLNGSYGNIFTARLNSLLPIPPVTISTPNQHLYDFLFGPVFSHRAHSYTAFAHGLFGGQHIGFGSFQVPGGFPLTLPGPSSETDLAFIFGGGLDFKVTQHFSIRAGEFDYQYVKSADNGHNHQNDFRYSTGVVVALGGE